MNSVPESGRMSGAKETARRREATMNPEQGEFRASGNSSRPMLDPEQAFALVNMISTSTKPSIDDPALRVLGFFRSQSHALAHAKTHYGDDYVASLRVVQACAMTLLPEHDGDRDAQADVAKIHKIEAVNTEIRKHDKKKFKERLEESQSERAPENLYIAPNPVGEEDSDAAPTPEAEAAILERQAAIDAQLRAGAEGDGDLDTRDGAPVAQGDAEAEEGSEGARDAEAPSGSAAHIADVVPVVPVTARLPKQRFCVVAFIEDFVDHTEPVVVVFGAFDMVEDAKQYMEDVLLSKIPDIDVSCVDMYEWVHPSSAGDDGIEQVYRHSELDRIMRKNRSRTTELAQYYEMCRVQGKDPLVTEINPDMLDGGEAAPIDASASRTEVMSLILRDESGNIVGGSGSTFEKAKAEGKVVDRSALTEAQAEGAGEGGGTTSEGAGEGGETKAGDA